MDGYREINGRKFFNATDKDIVFKINNETIVLKKPNPEYILKAKRVIVPLTDVFFTTKYVGEIDGQRIINYIKIIFGEDVIILCSDEVARTYPQQVVTTIGGVVKDLDKFIIYMNK